jgi:hypothetical protein
MRFALIFSTAELSLIRQYINFILIDKFLVKRTLSAKRKPFFAFAACELIDGRNKKKIKSGQNGHTACKNLKLFTKIVHSKLNVTTHSKKN